MPLSRTFDQLLNTPIVSTDFSYIAVSFDRVILFFLALHAAHRLLELLLILPKRKPDQAWWGYLRQPWWRVPAMMIGTGVLGQGVSMVLQVLTGDHGAASRISNLTLYLLMNHIFAALIFGGLAYGAGCMKQALSRRFS